MLDLHSGPWLLIVQEASVNVGPLWMTHQGRFANLDRKDGSTLWHGESKRGKEETEHHAKEQLWARDGHNATQSTMPTMSTKQPRNLLVPVNRLARDFSRSITYSKTSPFRHLGLKCWPFEQACTCPGKNIGRLLSNFCAALVEHLFNFWSTDPLARTPQRNIRATHMGGVPPEFLAFCCPRLSVTLTQKYGN